MHSTEVLSTESASGDLYTLADKLHLETRPSVIRKFLLFEEGDPTSACRTGTLIAASAPLLFRGYRLRPLSM